MDIGDWLDRASIVYRSSAAGKRQALSVVADAAAKATNLKATEILDALMEREAQGSTGVGRGVAVPHARLAGARSYEGGGGAAGKAGGVRRRGRLNRSTSSSPSLRLRLRRTSTCAPWRECRGCCVRARFESICGKPALPDAIYAVLRPGSGSERRLRRLRSS